MLPDPLITIMGSPIWLARVVSRLRQQGFVTQQLVHANRLIDDLLDHYPALLLVDGSDPAWEHSIRAVKAEQATRRIPVLVVLPDAALMPRASAVGADVPVLVADLDAQVIDRVRQHARVLSPEQMDTLRCQCREALPPLAQLGVKRFNAGAYYAQHDAFEELWMAESGPVRDLYRVILQVGVAYYHISRGNHAGGLKMLRRTVQWFAMLPDECQGIDVRQLREDANRVRAALHAMNPADIREFDQTLFKPVRIIK